jgi:hypothetical protein
VGLPVCPLQGALSGHLDLNSTVRNRNQMSVGDEVQNAARPRSVHATEQDVTIKGCPKPFFFGNAILYFVDDEVIGSRTQPQCFSKHGDFRPGMGSIVTGAMEQSIQIHSLNGIKVY